MGIINNLTNTWSDVKIYKVTDMEKYDNSKDSQEHLELVRIDSKGGKVIWEKLEDEEDVK